jgi:MFS family permease
VDEHLGDEHPVAVVPAVDHPLREVLALVPFRRFLIAQFLWGLVNGTLRFVLVWLTLDLTDWKPAVGLVGMALGVSSLLVAIPAGALSDRVDRKTLYVRVASVAAVAMGSLAALVAVDRANVALVAVHAGILGLLLTAVGPAMQAMIPSLVPRERLMNGVALQTMSMNVSLMTGALAGGAAIAVGGAAGGLALLAVLQVASVLAMVTVRFPTVDAADVGVSAPATTRLSADIGEGLRWASSHEPVRSLLAIILLIGFTWSGVQLLLPDLARDELGQGALTASLLFAPLGLGSLVTALVLASRGTVERRGRLLAVVCMVNLGPMVVLIGLSRSYLLTLALMAAWGVGGGIVMTLQRTLLQEHTPDRLMGRAMGLNTLGMLGAFPLAAGAAAALTAVVSTGVSLALMGATTAVIAVIVTMRRPVLSA